MSESHSLELVNASFSSPCASSPWRFVTVVSTAVSIVVSVLVTVATAAGTPLASETSLMASSIVSAPSCRVVDSSIDLILRLVPGVRVGLAEVVQVRLERLGRRLRVVGRRLHGVLRRIGS